MHSLHIDVITDNIETNPQCFHGPTLRFRRKGTTKGEYFACSACRDRTFCPFYLKLSDSHCNKQSARSADERLKVLLSLKYKKLKRLFKALKNSPPKERGYCHSCSVLFLASNDVRHGSCSTIQNITDRQLAYPTEICIPRENNKVEAQYLFSEETVNHMLKMLKKLKINRVVCIGTPRLHEYIVNSNETEMDSLLLDIDQKYHYFYPREKFVWYNMFNNFIMDEKQVRTLSSHLKTTHKVVILLDPPFGGRVEPIAVTLSKLTDEYNRLNSTCVKELSVIWFFPYYMERHIVESLPSFKMLDYQVNYDNHASFSDKGNRRRKAGSPVRLFSNIPLQDFDLSGIPGYRLCNMCGYWVSLSNAHCSDCQSCTSKNGMRYIHCIECKKCVKPSYSHCETCGRCCLTSHVCGQFTPDPNCYHCHQPGHKKSQCPDLEKKFKSKKKKRE